MSEYNPYREPVQRSVSGPVRTAVQLVPAAVFVEVADAFFYDFDDRQYAALLGLLLLVFSWAQNFIEQKKGAYFLR